MKYNKNDPGCWNTHLVESITAWRRGEEYFLQRRLFRRKSTGEIVNPAWLQFSFPIRWQYDVLRAREYFRSVGDAPDPRINEAIDLLRSKQQSDGTWLLENTHPVRFTLRWRTPMVSLANGTHCERCVSYAGTTRLTTKLSCCCIQS